MHSLEVTEASLNLKHAWIWQPVDFTECVSWGQM